MSDRIFNVLFVCTANSARSIMAEAILNQTDARHFHAYSAGSHPAGSINPMTIERLALEGVELKDARSKSWDEFLQPDAPVFDFVITVCDSAANESCPAWHGQPITAHWGVPDPMAIDDKERRLAFAKAFAVLERRISLFTSLRIETLERMALEKNVRSIGSVN